MRVSGAIAPRAAAKRKSVQLKWWDAKRRRLGLSPNTVKSHSRSLFTKLEAHNRV